MDWKLFAGYAVVVFVLGLVLATRRARVEGAVDRTADQVGLGIPSEIRPLLLRRIRVTRVGEVVGAAAGVGAGAVLVLLLHHGAPVQTFAVQGSIVAGGGIGGFVGGLVAARGLAAPGRRVARDRAVRVDDYISPVERNGVLAGAALAILVGVLSLVLGPADADVPVGLAAAAALLAWGGFEVAARRLVDRPQTAETALQLAWDDALRSNAVRRLAGSAGAVALFALLLAVWFETRALLPADAAEWVVLAVLVGVVAVLAAIRFWLGRSAPGRYFRDRLWPDTIVYLPEQVAP